MLSNEFIDDFYNIYKFDETNKDEFIVNLEIIAKWLETKKSKLKETLIKTYIKLVDYVVQLEKRQKYLNQIKKLYYSY